MGDKKASSRVLGLLIDETIQVLGAPAKAETTNGGFSLGQLQFIQRINRLINTATGAHDKMVIEAFTELVVHLPAQGYGTTEFDMSDARREAIIAAGRQTMRSYLNFRDEASFSMGEETTYEIDIADHANRVAKDILSW